METTMLRTMTVADYDQVKTLWDRTPGLGLSTVDSREGIGVFLARNPGLSFVCEYTGKIVGTILCGHDGRRGYVYHLAVDETLRHQGIGRQLTERSLEALRLSGIVKCHLFVYRSNEGAQLFYDRLGWQKRTTLDIFSKDL